MTIACNLTVFNSDERLRYNYLSSRVRASLTQRKETAEGFNFYLREAGISSPEIQEWIAMERLCCPFLLIEVSSSVDTPQVLTITGPSGVKPLILAEFPIIKHTVEP